MPSFPATTLNAPAKLTLSLRVTGVRDDGYHLIDAEMVSLDFHDRIEVAPGDGLRVVGAHGTETVGPDVDNLARRALALAGRTADVTLHKNIPAGAGLGGGSSDAAAILRWAGFTDLAAAARLGADIAYCLVGGRARVRGVGEIVDPLPFVPQTLTLVTPPVFCATPEVYRVWDELGGPVGSHGNDLEPAALTVAPELARWRDELGAATGEQPRLAGSGSTWFVEGAFPDAGRVVTTIPAP
ncbi:MAG: 4-(cytidine 5'-diphospho)-2-C-methyl-D-erythritol kinase [Actinomycetota bacterium]